MSKKIVICGGGVIGCSVAYHLSELGVGSDVTVVEPVDVACAASGNAGGFLARDWCDGSPVSELARKSFDLHHQLASSLGEDYGYRRLDTLSVVGSERARSLLPGEDDALPSWVDGSVHGFSQIGSTESTAQVHPRLFSKAMMRRAQEKGVSLVKDRVCGLKLGDHGNGKKRTQAVQLASGQEVEADVVAICMGPWSHQACKWLPRLPRVGTYKAHSITMKPSTVISAHALFTEYTASNHAEFTPEIYPRPDGEVYMCGMSDSKAVLPDSASQIEPTDGACERIKAIAGKFSSALEKCEIERRQACFLPTSPDGMPVIGAVPSVEGAFIAAGHSCWGILNSPATGKGLAELIVRGKSSSVDLSAFDPARFR